MLVVEIGKVALGIKGEFLYPCVREKYGAFLCEKDPDAVVEAVEKKRSFSEDRTVDVFFGEEILFHSPEMEARFSPGRVALRIENHVFAFDAFLRNFLAVYLCDKDGILVHSAAVIKDGRAYAFPGTSAAGKTTIVRELSPGLKALTDEILLIRKRKGVYFAFGTPFWGEGAQDGENISAPLAVVAFPEKGKRFSRKAIPATAAVGLLMKQVQFAGDGEKQLGEILSTAKGIIRQCEFFKLGFSLNGSFWEHL